MINQNGLKINYLRELYRLLDQAQRLQHRSIARELVRLIAHIERREVAI